jgi:hypothetical protein
MSVVGRENNFFPVGSLTVFVPALEAVT